MNAPDCICSPGRLPLGAFCAGRDDLEREALHDDRISIRAPRAGRDFLRLQDIARALISIHAPRVGRDAVEINFSTYVELFQSTRPVWGATTAGACRLPCGSISIHAPRVGRDLLGDAVHADDDDFNPRAPCGARPKIVAFYGLNDEFQSTRPVWGATCAYRDDRATGGNISIHAPRVGRDAKSGYTLGEVTVFQSTRPVWGATRFLIL